MRNRSVKNEPSNHSIKNVCDVFLEKNKQIIKKYGLDKELKRNSYLFMNKIKTEEEFKTCRSKSNQSLTESSIDNNNNIQEFDFKIYYCYNYNSVNRSFECLVPD